MQPETRQRQHRHGKTRVCQSPPSTNVASHRGYSPNPREHVFFLISSILSSFIHSSSGNLAGDLLTTRFSAVDFVSSKRIPTHRLEGDLDARDHDDIGGKDTED